MADNKNNKSNGLEKVNLNRYETDVEGVSMKTLEYGLWWTKNQKALKTALVLFLITISVISWGYTLYGFGHYLFIGMSQDDQLARSITESQGVSQAYLNQTIAKNLSISPANYQSTDGKIDLYDQIANPNSRWWATFHYCFKFPDSEQFCGDDFILPGDKKYVTSLGQTLNTSPAGFTFNIESLTWHKIDNHIIPDWNNYQAQRLNFEITGQQFTPASANSVSEKVGLNSLTFSITNKSAYSYWQLPLTIILTDGSQIVYVDRYLINDFASYDSRDVNITWSGDISNVSGISIIPDVNILDQGVFQQPK